MAPTTSGVTYVQPPTRTPYRYGLLDTVQVEAADPLRFPFAWESTACIQGNVWETNECLQPDPDTQEKEAGEPSLSVSGNLFTPYSPADPCLRSQILDRSRGQAWDRFKFAVEKLVSEHFWTTQLALDAEDVTPAGGAVDPRTAVGILEAELRNRYGAIGLIHASAVFSPWATSMCNISWTVPRRTVLDTVWVFGGGYPGTGPAGENTPGETWLYATGAVKVMHADEVRVETFDTRQNMVLAVAERPYAIGIDCNLVLAVRAKLNCCGTGSEEGDVEWIRPESGPPGTKITIKTTRVTGAAKVRIGSAYATEFRQVDANTITCKVPNIGKGTAVVDIHDASDRRVAHAGMGFKVTA